ncbi:MAG: PLP-dependent transferase, partial [Candidatus Sungiibacteriota bacterium]
SPMDSWLAEIGMRTLDLRMRRQSDSAKLIAAWLQAHPKIKQVYYPGLQGSPHYHLAQKYMPEGCGAVLAFELKGGKKEAASFMKSLKIIKHAINLGDTRSLATYPYCTTHSKMPYKDRRDAGITESLIRLSIGLEDPNDLAYDIEQALKKC